MSYPLKSESGFTLVELIITATFISAASLAAISIFINIGGLTRQSRNMAIATQFIQKKVEGYRNIGYQSIPTTEDLTPTLPAELDTPKGGTATFSDFAPAKDGLKKLDIELYYHEGTKRKDIKITTYVTRRGINR